MATLCGQGRLSQRVSGPVSGERMASYGHRRGAGPGWAPGALCYLNGDSPPGMHPTEVPRRAILLVERCAVPLKHSLLLTSPDSKIYFINSLGSQNQETDVLPMTGSWSLLSRSTGW